MARNRANGEDITAYFESLPPSAGTAEERVGATARHFNTAPATVHRHLKFWWPGQRYLEAFGSGRGRTKWDRPTEDILNALNTQGSVSKAARALGTTALTLTKAIKRHGIIQRWVSEASPEELTAAKSPRRRTRRKPQTKYLWPDGQSREKGQSLP